MSTTSTFSYKIAHIRHPIDPRAPAPRVGKIEAISCMTAMKAVMAAYGLSDSDYKRGNTLYDNDTCHVIGMERQPRKGKRDYTVTVIDLDANAESRKCVAQRRLWDAGLDTAQAAAALKAAAVS